MMVRVMYSSGYLSPVLFHLRGVTSGHQVEFNVSRRGECKESERIKSYRLQEVSDNS
jgi:hypothetical protein